MFTVRLFNCVIFGQICVVPKGVTGPLGYHNLNGDYMSDSVASISSECGVQRTYQNPSKL